MMLHFDVSLPMLLFWCAIFFLAALGAAVLCLSVAAPALLRYMDYRCLGREVKLAEYEAAIAEPVAPVAPPAEVHVGEVIAAPRADILPPAPPSLADIPIFATVPFTLPLEMDFGFNWAAALTAPTGAFPVIDAPKPKRKRKTPGELVRS